MTANATLITRATGSMLRAAVAVSMMRMLEDGNHASVRGCSCPVL